MERPPHTPDPYMEEKERRREERKEGEGGALAGAGSLCGGWGQSPVWWWCMVE